MSNKVREIIVPTDPHIFRTVFLYVGQGESTLLVVPDGEDYRYALIDSSFDESTGGIDIVELLKDLLGGEDEELDVYINTHPHQDHLAKVRQIYENVGIRQLWHSGHKPGGEHKEVYKDLEFVIRKLGEEKVFLLRGSREDNKLDKEEIRLGDVNYNILAPADYVSDDIEGEKPEERYRRIHEQCAVIRFRYGEEEKQILVTGDADYRAWKAHITEYHKDRLPSTVLQAAHHGSKSFFWEDSTDEEPYKEHLRKIGPTYIIVSAPKQKESKHGHPDKQAMDLYRIEVGEDSLFHLGEKRECIIVDINTDGDIDLYPNDELVKKYGGKNGENGGDDKKVMAPAVVTAVDRKSFGA